MRTYEEAYASLNETARGVMQKREALRDRMIAECPELYAFMQEARSVFDTKTDLIEINGEIVYQNGRVQ